MIGAFVEHDVRASLPDAAAVDATGVAAAPR
jgi:hypothetical protein